MFILTVFVTGMCATEHVEDSFCGFVYNGYVNCKVADIINLARFSTYFDLYSAATD